MSHPEKPEGGSFFNPAAHPFVAHLVNPKATNQFDLPTLYPTIYHRLIYPRGCQWESCNLRRKFSESINPDDLETIAQLLDWGDNRMLDEGSDLQKRWIKIMDRFPNAPLTAIAAAFLYAVAKEMREKENGH